MFRGGKTISFSLTGHLLAALDLVDLNLEASLEQGSTIKNTFIKSRELHNS